MNALSLTHTCCDARVVEIIGLSGTYDILVFANRSNAEAKANELTRALEEVELENAFIWVVAEAHGGYVVQKRNRETNRIVDTF